MQANKKHWGLCPECGLMVFAIRNSEPHRCPEKILAKRDAELDMVVAEEMSTWDVDFKKFWNSNDVKFWEYVYGMGKE